MTPKLTLNLGLRYEFATPHSARQPPGELRPGDADAHPGERVDLAAGRRSSRTEQLRAARRLRLQPDAALGVRGGYGISYILFTGWGARTCAYNGRFVVNSVITRSRRSASARGISSAASAGRRRYPRGVAPSRSTAHGARQLHAVRRAHRLHPEYHLSVRASSSRTCCSTCLRGNRASSSSSWPTTTGAAEQPGREHAAPQRRPSPTTHHPDFVPGGTAITTRSVKLERRFSGGLYLLNLHTGRRRSTTPRATSRRPTATTPRQHPESRGRKGCRATTTAQQHASLVYDLPFGSGRRFDLDSGLRRARGGGG